jgi:hypothetical protein
MNQDIADSDTRGQLLFHKIVIKHSGEHSKVLTLQHRRRFTTAFPLTGEFSKIV